jgi:hypothetical protein
VHTNSPTLQTVEGAVPCSLLDVNFTVLHKTDIRVNTLCRLVLSDNGRNGSLLPVWKPSAAVNDTFPVGQGVTYFKVIKWILTCANCVVASVRVENEINRHAVCELVGNSVVKHRCVLLMVADLAVSPLARAGEGCFGHDADLEFLSRG